ncbi:MAG: UDP-N-acetylglucosamine 2-epimerase [Solirubrobacteraceae bacterium]
MIAVIFGTTGELIKLAPVIRGLQAGGDPVFLACTNQQATQIPAMLSDFRLPQPDVQLAMGRRGRDLEILADIPFWLGAMLRGAPVSRRRIRAAFSSAQTLPLVLVHGDTMTTVLGAAIGRTMRVRVAHVEAGLRSGDWRNPFPEEIDRLLTSKLADLHYAPGAWAVGNLRRAGVSGEVVDIQANTVRDSLAMVPAGGLEDLPTEAFGLVSIHRFELLGNATRLEEVIGALHHASRQVPILFIDHPVTAAAIRDAHLEHYFDERFTRVPRRRYYEFIRLLKAAQFLVTDSGGSQEECAVLGVPCLVHRAATERLDGLDGGPVVLSRMDRTALVDFLADPDRHRRPDTVGQRSPSEIIVADLRARGYTAPA